MSNFTGKKLFFIALIVSIVLHITILSGLSGFINFDFLKPTIFKVVLVNLEETQPLKHDLEESTGYNPLKNFSRKKNVNKNRLLENTQGDNPRKYKAKIEEERITTNSKDAQNISEPSEPQGELPQASVGNNQNEAKNNNGCIVKIWDKTHLSLNSYGEDIIFHS